MRCVVFGCNVDSNCTSEGVTFHTLPTEPTLCEIWLKSLGKQSWEFSKNNVICSKHFQKDDLYVTRDGKFRVREGAVPVAYVQHAAKRDDWILCDLKVCRICFATDCNLYPITKYKKIYMAYELLTGLPIENNDDLPPYLCTECSHRLLKYIQFRNKSIQANLTMQEIVKKEHNLTLEAIRASDEYHLLMSNLDTHKQIDHYDLEIEHIEKEKTYTGEQGRLDDPSKLYVVNVVKVEKDEFFNRDIINDQDTTYDSVCPPRLHEVTLPGIKLEKDDLYSDNSPINEDTTDHYKDLSNLHNTVGIKIKVETIEMINQNCVDENIVDNADHILHRNVHAGEDYSSDDGLSLGEQGLEGNLTRNSVTKAPKFLTKTSVDQHWKPLSKSDDMPIINDKLPSRMESLNHLKLKTAIKLNSQKNVCEGIDNKDIQFKVRINSNKRQEHSCNICNKTFSRKHKLQLHLRRHSGEKPFLCGVCKHAFITKHMLSIHMRIHSGEKPYKCSVCGKSFSQKGNLNKHLRIHSGEKPYSCSVCVKSFTQKSNLNKHLKTHSGEKPYLCELCNKAFKQLSHLENHMRTHSGEKPYSCNICKKLFTIKCNLDKHLRVHSGEKRYSCEYCNKGFNENNRFQTHLRVHLGEKPFTCNVCEKAFSAKSCLQSHLKIHSDEKPYICNVCKKSFRHRNRLVTHLRTHSQQL